MGGWTGANMILSGESDATRVSAAATVGDFFGVFDVTRVVEP